MGKRAFIDWEHAEIIYIYNYYRAQNEKLRPLGGVTKKHRISFSTTACTCWKRRYKPLKYPVKNPVAGNLQRVLPEFLTRYHKMQFKHPSQQYGESPAELHRSSRLKTIPPSDRLNKKDARISVTH
ncbi:MAG: hypothetical protein MZU91_05435 [Desulfosudis oleivorans]|nr:hypothetical protein [Desulfosudis oleivorans]